MITLNKLLFALLIVTLAFSCEDDDGTMTTPDLEVPDTYTFDALGSSSVDYNGQATRIAMAEELVAAMSNPRTSLERLNNMFRNTPGTAPFEQQDLNESTKSVRSKVAVSSRYYADQTVLTAEIRSDFDGWLAAQANEVFPAWNELAAPGQAGQIADGDNVRYVSAGGLEYNQAFAKGLIGGLMYDQLANNYLHPSTLDADNNREDNDNGTFVEGKNYTAMAHKWDEAFGYLFGATRTPETPLSDLGTADNFLNKYLFRVENDPDYSGKAERIEAAFRRGRAAIVAGDYAERDRQASIITTELAEVIQVRSVYYMMQGRSFLEANPANLGGAFHALSEGYGFIYSLRFLSGRNAVSDDYLEILDNADGNGFWDIDPAALETLARDIASSYRIDFDQASN